ncbi:MAG: ATP-binding cassette domain-containing protein [Deltaproteobacteria bacterium]|nr:ATP-binding cassette domain-containing protein [Deltaproteobacteria bacterium]
MALLEVKNLVKKFPISGGLFGKTLGHIHAVTDVSFQIEEGQVLGLVGESGSGKTTLARTLMRLYEPDAGEILFDQKNWTSFSKRELQSHRKSIQMIFQDPYSSLNPRMKIGNIISESWKIHKSLPKKQMPEKVEELLTWVGLDPAAAHQYPHEFSGGQRQRIGIARALSLLPKMLICDEPVSALDVSVQAQILNLLMDLKKKLKLTYLLISHDLKVVHQVSDVVAIMYLGRLVEMLPASQLLKSRHPYTQALLQAIPIPDPQRKLNPVPVQGEIPSPMHPPSGCVFHTRCAYAQEHCKREIPVLRPLELSHTVACHLAEEIKPLSI